jgi:hypothetical protein
MIILDSPQWCRTTSMPPLSAAVTSFLASSGDNARLRLERRQLDVLQENRALGHRAMAADENIHL